MLSPERIALAKEVSHWHMFSDKTSDPKPGLMTIEEAESILSELSETEEGHKPWAWSV
jgi:hypothetical protein